MVWARIWSLGDNLIRWLTVWGIFLFLGGQTNQFLLKILLHTDKPTQWLFLPDYCTCNRRKVIQTRKVKVLESRLISRLNRGSMTVLCFILQNVSQQNLISVSPCKLHSSIPPSRRFLALSRPISSRKLSNESCLTVAISTLSSQ